jgi:hypothetical protein
MNECPPKADAMYSSDFQKDWVMGKPRIAWVIIGAAVFMAWAELGPPQSARADQVWSAGIHYEDAAIESIDDKTVTFVFEGKHLTKPNDATTRLDVEGFDPFNEAEQLLADKELAKAKLAYEIAGDKAKTDLQKQLVQMRSVFVRKSKPSATSKPAMQPDEKRCYFCRNTGKMRCPDCNGTGIGKCPDCKSGYVACTACGGSGKMKCTKCGGSGKVTSHTVQGTLVILSCARCDGTGFEKCNVCDTSKYPGMMLCPTCKGTGQASVCLTCAGEKTIPCTHCEIGKKLRDSLPPPKVVAKPPAKHPPTPDKQPDNPHDVVIVGTHHDTATKPDDTPVAVVQPPTPIYTKAPEPVNPPAPKEPEEPIIADPLSSADAMIRAIASFPPRPEKSPDWDAKSTALREEAQQQYKKDLAEWDKTHDFHKQHVRWRVTVQAVQPAWNKRDFLLLADTRAGAVVGVTFLRKDQDLVKSFSKEQTIWVSGTVKEYGGGPRENKDEWFNTNNGRSYDILLIEPTVETKDAAKDPASKPAK